MLDIDTRNVKAGVVGENFKRLAHKSPQTLLRNQVPTEQASICAGVAYERMVVALDAEPEEQFQLEVLFQNISPSENMPSSENAPLSEENAAPSSDDQQMITYETQPISAIDIEEADTSCMFANLDNINVSDVIGYNSEQNAAEDREVAIDFQNEIEVSSDQQSSPVQQHSSPVNPQLPENDVSESENEVPNNVVLAETFNKNIQYVEAFNKNIRYPIKRWGGKGRIMDITPTKELPYDDSSDDDEDESKTKRNDDSDSDSDSSSSSSSSSSSDDDEDAKSTTSGSLISLRDDLSASPIKARVLNRVKPEKRAISAVILKSIEPLAKEPPKYDMPKGRWNSPSYEHKYIKPTQNCKLISFCEVVFDDAPPDSDSIMVYNPNLNLVSIDEIVSGQKFEKHFIQTTMVETKYGKALKNLSTNYSINTCQYQRSIVNNATLTPTNYPLVYGAVPALLASDYVAYTLLKRYKFKKSANPETIPYIAEGELEIGAYCYTLLASLDLVKWKKDVSRIQLKSLLMHACGLIPDKDVRRQIAAYIDFRDTRYISAECLLLIKRDYPKIIASLRRIEDPKNSKRAIDIWNCFMYKCNIHHYLCPHTLTEIARGIKIIGKNLISKVDDLELQNADYDLTGVRYTFDEIKVLLNFVPHLNTSTTDSLKSVQKSINSLYTHIVKLFADHIVDYGIYPTTVKINSTHVDGFRLRYAKLLSTNAHNAHIPIFESKFSNISSTIITRIQQRKSDFDLEKPIKMDRDALMALMYVVNMIILKRLEVLLFLENRDISIGQAIYHELQTLFESTEFTSINDIEAWSRTDDISTEDLSDDEYALGESDDESSSGDDESDDDLYNEGQLLLLDNSKSYVAPPSVSMKAKKQRTKNVSAKSILVDDSCPTPTRSSSTSSSSSSHPKPSASIAQSSGIKRITDRNYKQVIDETPYRMSGNISRVLCVMCKRSRTLKSIAIGDDIEIACCMSCFKRLVIDYASADEERKFDHDAIITRIRNQFKPPIAFGVNDEFIEHANFTRQVVPRRAIYNRKLPEYKTSAVSGRQCTIEESFKHEPLVIISKRKSTDSDTNCSKKAKLDDNDDDGHQTDESMS
nr:TPA: gp28-like protein [Oryctes rhinoceros nudivirus]